MERVLENRLVTCTHLFVHLLTPMRAISRLESRVFQAYTINTIRLPFFTYLYVLLCTQPLFVTSHKITVTEGLKFWSQHEVVANDQRENVPAIMDLPFYWLQFIGFFSFGKAKIWGGGLVASVLTELNFF